MDTTLGMLIFALGGLSGAVFALPFRKVKGWSYESYWLVYAVFGLVLFPLALASLMVPDLFGVIGATPAKTLLACAGFGALWGIGGLTWGLMIRYLGVGLGLHDLGPPGRESVGGDRGCLEGEGAGVGAATKAMAPSACSKHQWAMSERLRMWASSIWWPGSMRTSWVMRPFII